ncbi:uncharacterized protein [Eurosta solidaginis]|uniref:uncharacterized protein isoform X3 n=1 Tax=Eurosta solidaginis TaxID=178769 RepID=UPI003530642E
MSNMKNGISTLNRWLGKKSKTDKVTPNGKLSKSSTNLNSLSVSTANINETSQLEYNRITPLPVATSNAPFEQTFRITVLLPKDQLYVARLGARVPLSKLLELVCENKLLDSTKYEFRNPVDPSLVYSCDLTIGAVGLSEVRLCHKSESYDSFNADEIIKLHRTAIIRDSLSSSEFSSRYSKHTTKTTSPYSSSNSLNSMDSTGMNCVRTPVSPPTTMPTATTPLKIAAPPRKKRAAPRPPSQIAIPEKTALGSADEDPTIKPTELNGTGNFGSPNDSASLNNRFVSTPNLSITPTTVDDIKAEQNGYLNSSAAESTLEPSLNGYAHVGLEQEKSQVLQKNARNLCGGSVQNLSSPHVLQQSAEFPEPSPRKRMIQVKKKTAAPAPPSRSSMYADSDTMSIRSVTICTPDTPLAALTPNSPSDYVTNETSPALENFPLSSKKQESPIKADNSEPEITRLQASTPVLETNFTEPAQISSEAATSVPKPLPRVTTNTLLNANNSLNESSESPLATTNVSKIMLNRTPTPEPRSLSAEPSESESYLGAHIAALRNISVIERDDDEPSKTEDSATFLSAHIAALKNASVLEQDDDVLSKQADSGIGEPVPSPIPDSLPSEGSAHEGKSAFESSSDDDDIVKVYNFKLGKTVVKSPTDPHTLEDFSILSAAAHSDSGDVTPAPLTQEAIPNFSDSASWKFTIPISPPPNFADGRFANGFDSDKKSDMPITPKIKERPVLDFESISSTEGSNIQKIESSSGETKTSHKKQNHNVISEPLQSPTAPLNEIVDELSAIINEKRLDSLIKKPEDRPEIEAAKPNTLSNFSITTITQQTQEKQSKEIAEDDSSEIKAVTDVLKHIHTINESTALIPQNSNRSDESVSTQLPTEKIEQSEFGSSRRSSGELSIGESPTLQSPEVIKTILNSRKNSLVSNGEGENKPTLDSIKLEEKKSAGTKADSVEETLNLIEETKEVSITEHNIALVTESTKPKELPKIYRYSGPPSINFSTWDERPKAQVSIKNEGDYIFGGKHADSQSAAVTTAAIEINTNSYGRHNRVSMPASRFWAERDNAPPPLSPKPTANASPTERMGIIEKDFRVPITVKPLRDVIVENGNTNVTTQQPANKVTYRRTHTSSLPRSNTNRYSMPAGSIVGPALLRSTSITQLEANKPKQSQADAAVAPFGQNTLRKTGLKEKILAKEAELRREENGVHTETSNSNQTNTKYTTTISNGFVNYNQKPEAIQQGNADAKLFKPTQSGKLELKLYNPTSIYMNQIHTNSSTSSSPTKSKPVTPTPPPPPLWAVMMRTPNGSAPTTPNSAEPRDQLLMAIRNFKREQLNRVV